MTEKERYRLANEAHQLSERLVYLMNEIHNERDQEAKFKLIDEYEETRILLKVALTKVG